ncbi:glycosyltransferase family 4 protein [Pseudomonas sichuanensis]|uniref:glycosyltransferase family 4 protein n=1 Tax=Pseudomonas sichuanensis TaxID=2213015 RepID=UPI00244C9769|nr:glycosyltransferase family 4 protein [Pseudomonas sichuanensis]MDH0732181.1 glycosyltransferase family 4 protein [Pseudomonas sichuanensis]MDH1584890.1 glycosyltransferase family 4 protein [Pseudomonas sichuanensis]MDH1592888.1 glycosyltransferase family 4 protein [Pseudomonas sichuanensis]MDH1599833.1 glycosyltransferase family 4 protein [Pseudomonas sichuanensis]
MHPAAAFGGASKSLIELYTCLRQQGVTATVLTPHGPVCEAFSAAGMDVRAVRGLSQFDNTRYGYYRRLRWIILLRELLLLPFSLAAIWRLRHERFDLLHVNEITLLPLALLAKRLLRIPMVVHIRSLQRSPGSGLRTRLINHWLARHADARVAIDHTVKQTLDSALQVQVVHNGLGIDNVPARNAGRATAVVNVGFLGVLIALKGIYELIEAMRILKARGVPVHCLVAGENARQLSGVKAWVLGKLGFARDVRADVQRLIAQHELQGHVSLLGFVGDVRTLYPQLDVLCFPSHLNAAGRPVFEAAFYSIPSVVAVENPVPDAIIHEVTGLAIARPDPVLLADALQRLVENAAFREQLGRQAEAWAQDNFSINANASLMHGIYRQLAPAPVTEQP